MKRIISFLAGTTALVSLSSVAFAADMDPLRAAPAPVIAAAFEPAPPVVNCKDKKGYYIVPNTNTCLAVQGMIRAQVYVHEDNVSADNWTSDAFGSIKDNTTTNDSFAMQTIARFGVDTVTTTDYGDLRGFIQFQGDPEGDKPVNVRLAFIEWNGFKFGHTDSFFGPDGALGGYGGVVGDYGDKHTLFGYTAEFTKEISASIAIEDHDKMDGADGKSPSGTGGVIPGANSDIIISTPGTLVHNDASRLPDLVGNITGNFDWGMLFASGALGQYRTIEPVSKYRDDFIGWAVGLGGNVNLDGIAKGDAVQAKIGYADGATNYLGSSDDAAVVDTTVGSKTILTTAGWTAQGSFKHNWSPSWSSLAYAGYANATRGSTPATLAAVDDNIVDAWNLGANLQWSPVAKYTIGGEIYYANITKENSSTGKSSQDALGSVFRVERSF